MDKLKQPCPFFQRGICRFGDACKYSHTTSPHDSGSVQKLPCHAFARGACRYGNWCKFSHDPLAWQENGLNGKQSEQAMQAPQSSGSTAYDQFVQWRYHVKKEKRDINMAQPLGRRFAGFIQQALALLDDANTMQEIITTLSNEGGLARLGEMLNADFALLEDEAMRNSFRTELLPFLRIIAHHQVLSSSVLETRLGTLLNYLYGINGKRSVAVFTAAIRGLTYEELSQAEFEPCLISLSAVLEVNRSAQVNDDLRSCAETIIALAKDCPLSGNALKYYKKMCLRLGLGENIGAAPNQSKHDHTRRKPTFELLVDQPGNLSKQGPRHDNDFQDIHHIQILPTMGEILGDRAEYLPRSDPSTWHLQGAAGLLDRQFRLLRQDTVGQLRDAARLELSRIQDPFEQTGALKDTGARTYSYRNVRLIDVEMDPQKGLLCVLEFDQPRELINKSQSQRKEWWAESGRLAPEALIMLLGSDQMAVFLTVLAATFPSEASNKSERSIEKLYPRAGDQRKANVIVQLVNHIDADIETLLFHFGFAYKESHKNLSFSLLEFPGVLLPAFKHTLEALQHMTLSEDLPFAELLAPTADSQHATQVEAPAYTKRQGFSFDLSTLSTNHENETITLDVNSPMQADLLSAQTTLDHSQAEALISTLCRSVALIQGPPGTGKSYTGVALIKVLIENKKAANLGPVLCVTFTNHALDQILEHLVDADVDQVIRIGSRCKSERLLALNLRAVAQKEPWTKLEARERWQHKQNVEHFRTLASESLRELQRFSQASVLTYLKERYPCYHDQLVAPEIDQDGFELVQNKRAAVGIAPWLKGAPRFSPMPGGNHGHDIFSLSVAERQRLYSHWVEQILDPIQQSLLANLKAYQDAKAGINKIRAEVDHRVLEGANVIGVTTSGLARNLDLLRRLNSKVLVVEEAGEVLEAHLLTAMLPSIEHAILIGDHQQLRPKAQNYELSVDNARSQVKMDISLFERLVHPNENENRAVPFVTLEIQRRMHPSISTLIRSTLYPDLHDDAVVAKYPQVSGMRRRLFWLDHREAEDSGKERSDSTSHTNRYEVDMVFALVRHLVRQGVYRRSDIAVLTPYLGQLRKLRRSLNSFAEVIINDRDIDEMALNSDGEDDDEVQEAFSGVTNARQPPRLGVHKSTLLQALRLATVDNFQGEEAKVVIISLVRSNEQRKCGFLRTSNRINVLLSRAQQGMYIIGNSETYAHIPMWGHVLEMLNKDGNLGPHLELCCPRHPETPLQITTPDDFSIVSPEAGCNLLCGQRLPCGHSCVNKCHSDGMHQSTYCLKPCNRAKEGCSHNCQYVCGQQCDENCTIQVSNIDVELPCGHHVSKLPCWQYQDPSQAVCRALVERIVPGCLHRVTLPCCIDVRAGDYVCLARCACLLPCGHACGEQCCKCRPRMLGEIEKEEHGKCQQPCKRDYSSCKHSCSAPCHGEEPCPLCSERCDVSCSHTRCMKQCHEPCAPCAEEDCASCCPHAKCSMPCAAPCDWVPCSKRCTKLLQCGHQCPSVCGADCPPATSCQICCDDDLKALQADLIMFTTYGELDISEKPCMFLPCGHIFTVESLDGVMAMADYYELDSLTGAPIALKGTVAAFSQEEMKTCPTCRASLRLLPRYGRIVRRALLDQSTKKFIAWAHRRHFLFAKLMRFEQDRLINTRSDVHLRYPVKIVLAQKSHVEVLSKLDLFGGRYRDLARLRRKLSAFLKQTEAEEQPFRRVYNIVETLRRRRLQDGHTIDGFEYDQDLLQTHVALFKLCNSYCLGIGLNKLHCSATIKLHDDSGWCSLYILS
ncbi:uncharacterized protein UHO2_07028 [Ustilago hordei]|uniref:C3H1-type domain-containing protein n=1 Tax=Ustilago hordei TaxID=120017 RepID=I2FNG1_USTHO|nr:uncharacterized protein UHO2_07028 [Ustilago hordei]CCF48454.1 uncharacterized protein UHOR_13173 [Ustilago hordei]SYW81120.1 related to NF-X1 finger and helicase domain protein [Ustilago hordei]